MNPIAQSGTSYAAAALRRELTQPSTGVVGIVDLLLQLCSEHEVDLDWRNDCCRIHSRVCDAKEIVDVPPRRSVFRAILARIAAVCNERCPESMSPYGGRCELPAAHSPAELLEITFANTADEQWLMISGG
jgi:hypothetical protein